MLATEVPLDIGTATLFAAANRRGGGKLAETLLTSR
jgi:hypothetical protein